MLIEYKIKFEKNGVTITQRVEPGSSGTVGARAKLEAASATVVNKTGSKDLGEKYTPPEAASSPDPAVGAGDVAPADSGEGNTTDNGVDGGFIIVFGPVVITGSALGDSGGGDVPPADSGELTN